LNGNLNIGGNLSVSQFSSNKTITTTNYQLVVAEDLSLNGRLFVSGNVGVGTTNPQYTLDVNGVIRSSNLPKYWNYVRLYTSGGISSTATYFLIGTMNDYANSGAGGAICINGTVGGWTIVDKSNINITLTTRGASATTIGVIGSMTSSATLSTILNILDFVVYYQGGGGSANTPQYYVYLKTTNNFPWFDFTVTGNDQRTDSVVLSEPAQGTTTVPSGTLLTGTPSVLAALQTYTMAGNVGIGTRAPAYTLDVSAASTAPFRVGVGSTNAIAVNSSGNVVLGGSLSVFGTMMSYISVIDSAGATSYTTSLSYTTFNSVSAYGGVFSSSSLANNTVTIPIAGTYYIIASISVAASAANNNLFLYVFKSGITMTSALAGAGPSQWTSCTMNGIFTLAANDTINVPGISAATGITFTAGASTKSTLTIIKM
jgi:hypothetical protein